MSTLTKDLTILNIYKLQETTKAFGYSIEQLASFDLLTLESIENDLYERERVITQLPDNIDPRNKSTLELNNILKGHRMINNIEVRIHTSVIVEFNALKIHELFYPVTNQSNLCMKLTKNTYCFVGNFSIMKVSDIKLNTYRAQILPKDM